MPGCRKSGFGSKTAAATAVDHPSRIVRILPRCQRQQIIHAGLAGLRAETSNGVARRLYHPRVRILEQGSKLRAAASAREPRKPIASQAP